MANPNPVNRFQRGNQFGGRTKGAKARLSDRFFEALSADFEEHADVVIGKVRENDATAYLNIVAKLMPRELEAKLQVQSIPAGLDAAEWAIVADLARFVRQAGAGDVPKEVVAQWIMEDLRGRMAAALPQLKVLPALPPPCPVAIPD